MFLILIILQSPTYIKHRSELIFECNDFIIPFQIKFKNKFTESCTKGVRVYTSHGENILNLWAKL